MSKPSTSRRRTHTAPPAQPVRIADWKKQHGIEDFPGGIVPKGFQSATVYFFHHPAQLYGGYKAGQILHCPMMEAWPDEGIQIGDTIIVRCGPTTAGSIVYTIPKGWEGETLIARLLRRDANGTIQLQDSTGAIHTLRRGECELVGEVIDFPSAAGRLR
jgi:hypothetical protein